MQSYAVVETDDKKVFVVSENWLINEKETYFPNKKVNSQTSLKQHLKLPGHIILVKEIVNKKKPGSFATEKEVGKVISDVFK